MSGFDIFADACTPGSTGIRGDRAASVRHRLLELHALDLRDGKEGEHREARKKHQTAFHEGRSRSAEAVQLRREMTEGRKKLVDLGLEGIAPEALDRLPAGSVVLEFGFTLAKKFLSRDDQVFYAIDNPVRKEWVFGIPMTAGSSWKGNLRMAAVENLMAHAADPEKAGRERAALVDIFGDEKGDEPGEENLESPQMAAVLDKYLGKKATRRVPAGQAPEPEESSRKGRLRLLPTYYDRVELDMINPRNRITRAGTQPIAMEVVPAGAKGRFGAIYIPFDLLGRDEPTVVAEVKRDWGLILSALYRMLRVSGFGAKKSSGNGKASEAIEGFRLECRLEGFGAFQATKLSELKGIAESLGVSR